MTATATRRVDADEIARTCNLLFEPGQVTELRALGAVTDADRWPHTYCGYFDDPKKLVEAVEFIRHAEGVYVTPNPVAPALLARSMNKARKAIAKAASTSDKDIVRRHYLLIDCDPVRPAGIPSNDEEHKAALSRIIAIDADLADKGWPTGLIADSGNGAHLIYRIDVPAADNGLIERCLKALALEHDDEHVKVDTSVHNPARIWKLYGTLAGKGDPEAAEIGRPQRMSRIISAPDALEVVPTEKLEALAATLPAPEPPKQQQHTNGAASHFNLRDWITRYHLQVGEPEDWQGGTRWVFRECPFDGSHTDGAAYLLQHRSGAISAGCHHNGCQGKGWRELRAIYEPNRHASNGQSMNQPKPAAKDEPEREKFIYRKFTCAELAGTHFTTEYLIPGLLVRGEPCIVAGGKKTLKTSLAEDLAFSLATGGFFLGKFRVNRPARVGFMSGESGLPTLKETLGRIAEAAGVVLADVDGLIVSPDLPRFGSFDHEDALTQFITENAIETLIIDPCYLCMPGADVGNLFIQGELLRRVNEICQPLGVTLIVLHHTKKSVADPFAAPELEDIAWAGFQEWCRQWLLLGRRERYEPGTGEHRLWLSAGGSAGHSSLWALDIAEGVYDGTTPRYWQVDVMPAAEARKAVKDREDEAKAAKRGDQLNRDVTALVRATAKFADGESKNVLRDKTALNSVRLNAALAEALDRGELVTCMVVKGRNKRTVEGYKLAPSEDQNQ